MTRPYRSIETRRVFHRLGVFLAITALANALVTPIAFAGPAKLITDPNAPIRFQPKIGTSEKGAPVVDITTPSFGGLSHNKFQRYDIDSRGVILNNAKLTGTSLIGGKVVANPNLARSRPARVILNEVTSNAASSLAGPTEVFGAKAQVVVANPNGIACAGCTFLNAGRVTLSTGVPLPDYRRGTVAFDVTRGAVTITGKGLSAPGGGALDAVDLIARQIDLKGPLVAKDAVRLRTGAMIYSQGGDRATLKDAATLPALVGPAIRSYANGTIFAGTISAVARDAGIGASFEGYLASLSGSIDLHSNGDLALRASRAVGDLRLDAKGQVWLTGSSQVLGRIAISAGKVEVALTGELAANDAIVIEALGALTSRGVLKAGNTVSIAAGGAVVAEGVIAAGGEVGIEGRTFAGKTLEVGGSNVSIVGLEGADLAGVKAVASKASVRVAGADISLGEGTSFGAKQRIVIDAKGTLTNGTVLSYDNLDLWIRDRYVGTRTGELVQDHILFTLSGDFVNAGLVYARIKSAIEASNLVNEVGGTIYGPDVTLTARSTIENRGKILSEKTLAIAAGEAVRNEGSLESNGTLSLKGASYRAGSPSALLAAAAANVIVAGDLLNAGTIAGTRGLTIKAGGQVSSAGSMLAAAGDLALTAAGQVTSGADLIADGTLTLKAAGFINTAQARIGATSIAVDVSDTFAQRGFLAGTGAVTIKAGSITNGPTMADTQSGQMLASAFELQAASAISNQGAIEALQTIAASGAALANSGRIVAQGDASFTVSGLVTNNGAIETVQSLALAAGSYTAGTAAARLSAATMNLATSGALTNAGAILASDLLTLVSGPLANVGASAVIGGKTTVVTANGNLWNEGEISASQGLRVAIHGAMGNAGRMIAAGGSLGLFADGALSNAGAILAQGALTVTGAAFANVSAGAQLGGDAMSVDVSGLFSNLGVVDGVKSLSLKSGALSNGVGAMINGGTATLVVAGGAANQGQLQSAKTLFVVSAGDFANTGTVAANDNLVLAQGGALANGGAIAAGARTTVNAASYSGGAGSSLSSASLAMKLSGGFANAGALDVLGDLSLVAAHVHNAASGAIDVGALVATASSGMTNAGTIKSAGAANLTIAGDLVNSGEFASLDAIVASVSGRLDNGGAIQAAKGIAVDAGNVLNRAAGHIQGAVVVLKARADVDNRGAVKGLDRVEIRAQNLKNRGGASASASIVSDDLLVDVVNEIDNGPYALLSGKQTATIEAASVNAGFLAGGSIADGKFAFGHDLSFTLTRGGYVFNDPFKVKGNLHFKVAGDIVNKSVIAAAGDLTLISRSGSIINGSSAPPATPLDPGSTIYSGGNMVLDAGDDIENWGSTILSGGNIALDAGGAIVNSRTAVGQTVSWGYTPEGALYRLTSQSETSIASSISAMGAVTGTADTVRNVASTIAAGSNLDLTADRIVNESRTLVDTYLGYDNDGTPQPERQVPTSTSLALLAAGGVLRLTGSVSGNGSQQAGSIVITGPVVTIGNPNVPNGPARLPDPVISLDTGFNLSAAGFQPGSGPAFLPDPSARSGKLDASATGGSTRPGETPVIASGRIKFLHAVPFGTNERNASWILAQVGDSRGNLTFFADPGTERQLIQRALVEQTGRALLDPKYRNPVEQQEELYRGTVAFLEANTAVRLGDSLTSAQRAKVKTPILWYVYKTIDGKRVLVPELILPERDLAKYAAVAGGALMARDIHIAGDKVSNTGTILATNALVIDAGEFLNERKVTTAVSYRGLESVLQSGGVLSAKALSITTVRDLVNRGGAILAGKDGLSLKAGGDLVIEAQRVENVTIAGNKKHWSVTSTVRNVGALVASGGDLVLSAGGTLSILGSNVTAKGDASLVGQRGVTIASVLDETDILAGGKKSGFLRSSSFGSSDVATTNVSSVVFAGKNLTVRSERGDITIAASHLVAGKDLGVLAGFDAKGERIKGSDASVHILSGQDVRDTAFQQKKSGFGLFASGGGVDVYRSSAMALTTATGRNVASSLSAGGNIAVKAARDIGVIGSVINARGFATLDAGRDVTIAPGSDRSSYAFAKKAKGIGLSISSDPGSASASLGYHARSDVVAHDLDAVAPSVIHGGKGVSITGGRDVTIAAATIASKEHVAIKAGRDLDILSGTTTERSLQSSKEVFAGITAKIGENVSGALEQLRQAPGTFSSGYGGSGYKAVGAVSGTLQAIDALSALSRPTISASLTLGASGSRSQGSSLSTSAVPTTITATSLSLAAGRDMHLQGTQVDVAKDIAITAGRDLVIESAQSTTQSASSSLQWNAGVGLHASVSLSESPQLGVTIGGGMGRAQAGSFSVTQLNAHLNAGGTVSITSGRDATLAGATVKAADIALDIGRNLTVASRQDVAQGASSSMSVSASAIIGPAGPSSVSLSGGMGRGSSDFAWVTEQSGLFATDSLAVTVRKHTQVDGAVMTSEAGKLTLDTGTLTVTTIADHDKGTSYSAQAGFNTPGTPGALPGVTVSGSFATHDTEQETHGTIGAGTITIRDPKNQKQDVASINRDVTRAQVITKDERKGVKVYASSNAVKELTSGFAETRENFAKYGRNFENVPANVKRAIEQALSATSVIGRTADEVLGGILEQIFSPGVARIGAALKNRELDYDSLKRSLTNCGQQGFNLHDLLFTPAYANGGCPVTMSNGQVVYLTKAEQDSCWYAAGQAVLGVLWRGFSVSANAAATKGFAAGVVEAAGSDLRALGNLSGYVVALTYDASDPQRQEAEQFFGAMRNQVVGMLKDPVGTLKGAAGDFVDSVRDQSILYTQAAAQGDYATMGRIEGELVYVIAATMASGAAANAVGKGTIAAIKASIPEIAEARLLGLGKVAAPEASKAVDAGVKWGGDIEKQGLSWEDHLAKGMPEGARLPKNFKTFDFFDSDTGLATSAKTMNTMTPARIAKPADLYYTLKSNIDKMLAYNQTHLLNGVSLNPDRIFVRDLHVAIPEGTTAAQWEQIERAISYARAMSNSVNVKITVAK
jgi:filamentous hemagglutinin